MEYLILLSSLCMNEQTISLVHAVIFERKKKTTFEKKISNTQISAVSGAVSFLELSDIHVLRYSNKATRSRMSFGMARFATRLKNVILHTHLDGGWNYLFEFEFETSRTILLSSLPKCINF